MTMEEEKKHPIRDSIIDFLISVGPTLVVTIIMFAGFFWFIGEVSNEFEVDHSYETNETYEIWDAKAPFGNYWTNTEGSGNFIYYESTSSLTESYTIKYLDDGELKTVILSATSSSTHIVFTQNNTMSLKIVYRVDVYGDGDEKTTLTDYYVYIPDPSTIPSSAVAV